MKPFLKGIELWEILLRDSVHILWSEVEPLSASGYTRWMGQSPKFVFLGAGNMADALVTGILKAHLASPANISVTDISSIRLEHFQKTFQVHVGSENADAVKSADIIVLCVKPQVMDTVLEEIKEQISQDHLLISVAAGYPLARIQEHVGRNISLIRAMPNTPALIQEGVTALAGSSGISPDHLHLAQSIFESVGKVVMVEESLMDAVTGLSGSGPAYIYLVIEALTDGGVLVGLPRTVASVLAAQTVLGAARMVIESGEHPAVLKDRVTSPGGTTIAGLQHLETGGLRATLMEAVKAATARSYELGQ
ncbi:pyrroline-5-carboxylate reductase [Candidatus Nitrospira allomarina]|nr:pyrroline-5-carboxylate reductase [Candidatus Nitrospira allomarina]